MSAVELLKAVLREVDINRLPIELVSEIDDLLDEADEANEAQRDLFTEAA